MNPGGLEPNMCTQKHANMYILWKKNVGEMGGCHGNWNGSAGGVCRTVHGV